ncbi:MAG: hypothetical protein QNK23_07160 [Crocinitomicaceae bacterium]|nr:hypothetical protein [Crocinitomicaceae bacterium]
MGKQLFTFILFIAITHVSWGQVFDQPALYCGSIPNGGMCDRKEKRLFVKYPAESPSSGTFNIISWEYVLLDKHFRGSGSTLSADLLKILQVVPSGTKTYIRVTIGCPDGIRRNMAAEFTIR